MDQIYEDIICIDILPCSRQWQTFADTCAPSWSTARRRHADHANRKCVTARQWTGYRHYSVDTRISLLLVSLRYAMQLEILKLISVTIHHTLFMLFTLTHV